MTRALLRDIDAQSRRWPHGALALVRACGAPTWIRQRGLDSSRCRLVVTLLHGNEPSGSFAVAAWLASGRTPAVDTAFYIASVEAALTDPVFTHRMMPGQRDANRTYRPPFDDSSGQLAQEVLRRIESSQPEAVLDLHNNTGHNPAYGVATNTSVATQTLTSLFAERLVHSDLHLGALVEASSGWCPSVVIECGRAGDPAADQLAWRGLKRFLLSDELGLDQELVAPTPMQILHSPVRVIAKPGVSLAFDAESHPAAGLTIDVRAESFNFEPMPAGERIGWASNPSALPIEAYGASGRDVAAQMFENRGGAIVTREPIVPVMMTVNAAIALSDCLFYATRSD